MGILFRKWVKPGDKVLIIDDVLATGGTINAAIKLLQNEGVIVQGVVVLNMPVGRYSTVMDKLLSFLK